MPENIESPSLKYNQELPESMDYSFLRKEGIQYVQELSGKIWTDYNEHDPGVTILEQCCFALTDLAYRTNSDIDKILFSHGEKKKIAASNSLYTPEEILLSCDVTMLDHKMLFMDKLKSISNIWFRKANSDINGLYDIYVQPSTNQTGEAEIESSVKSLFAANRNLCEDVNKVVVLKPEDLEIASTIDIYEEYGVEEVLAEVYFQLDSYFSSKVTFDSLDTLLNQGLTYDEIFDRPSFDKNAGFINVSHMEDYQTTFSFSKIQTKISEVKGVRYVQNLLIKKNGIKIGGEQIDIEEGNFASILAVLEKPAIVVNRNHIRVEYNMEKVKSLYHQKVAEATKKYFFHSLIDFKNEIGRSKENSAYSSIQNTFPVTYGIGNYGLSENEGNERKRYAKQLQGFLLFFDQILLNHLAQLKNIPNLFSIEENQTKTYFEQLPYKRKESTGFGFPETAVNIPDVDELVKSEFRKNESLLHDLMNDRFEERKNRMLNHLLARFSEKFVEETHHNLKGIYGISSSEEINSTLIRLKYAYLKQYKLLSKNKNRGYNYNKPEWNGQSLLQEQDINRELTTWNGYPFKKKLFLLLNLPEKNEGMGSLLSDYSQIKVKSVSKKEKEEMRSGNSDNDKKDTSYYKPNKEKNSSKVTFLLPESADAIDNLMYYGARRDSYFISGKKLSATKFHLFFKSVGNDLHLELGEYETHKEAEEVIEKLIRKFNDLNQRSEGFHVVEHILLRPLLEEQYEIRIEVEAEKKEEKKKAIMLHTMVSDTYEANKQLLKDLINLGTKNSNFSIAEEQSNETQNKDKTKTYFVMLKDKHGNELLKLNTIFASILIAQTYIDEKLVPFFKLMSKEKSPIPAAVHINSLKNMIVSDEADSLYTTDHAFFDSRISLVIPDWLPRFNEPDFRALLHNSLTRCLPAHIYINLIWLNKENMYAFEKIYLEWMEIRSHNFTRGLVTGQGILADRKENIRWREDRLKLDRIAANLIEKLKKWSL